MAQKYNSNYLARLMGFTTFEPVQLHDDIRLQQRVLWAGVVLMAIKVVAWQITGSNAIFSDTLESLVNVAAGWFALYSLRLAAIPKDQNHPYGHGKVEFISGSIEGVLILLAGLGIVGKATYDTIFPHEIGNLGLGMLLAGVAGTINFYMGTILVQRGKVSRSMTMMANGAHLKSDGYTSMAMLLGVALVWAIGFHWIDNLVAASFGIFIAVTGTRILRKSIGGIMDETDFELIAALTGHLQSHRTSRWIDVHNLRIIRYGRSLHVDCHLTLPYYLTLQETHDEVEALEDVIKDFFGSPTEVFVHADPCRPVCCHLCEIANCPVRKHPFEQRVTWEATLLVKNSKHAYGTEWHQRHDGAMDRRLDDGE
jgi:cation diffusion facilitator family transporter